MTTRTAPIDWRREIRVVGAHGAAKTNCTRVASSIVWLVVVTRGAVGMRTWNATAIRQCDFNGAVVCTFKSAVIVVLLATYAM